MRNFTEEERKLAVKMWKKIKNSPFRYTSYIRKKFAEKHGLRWLGDNFFCHVLIDKSDGCDKCPLSTETGKCGEIGGVYYELQTIHTRAKTMKNRWKSLCRDVINAIKSFTPDNKDNKEGGGE